MDKFNQIVVDLLKPASGKSEKEIEKAIDLPPDVSQGHRAIPCFRWAKEASLPPQKLAEEWKKKMESKSLPKEIDKIEAVSGYLNFFFNRMFVADQVLGEIH